ncbi:PLxRFG domain-containing protein [Vibrio alginolyticus]|uniref:PLxRFG domain-containing protein n=1 Tax=Vibrio alginolyticus TaxID=663 RepID=UPI002FF178A3
MVAYRDWQNKRSELEESQNTNIGSDLIDLAQQGILQTGAGVANFLGADATAESLDKWAGEQNETLTPEMRNAMAKNIINDDMSFGEGSKDWRTWLGSAANILGGMAVTMVPGGAAGKAASIAGGGMKVANGANISTNALLNLAAGNGGQSLNVKQEIENTSFEDLSDSPIFRQYAIEGSDSGLSDDEALNKARLRIAEEASHAVKTDFTLGAVNLIAETVGDQAFSKLLKGSIGKTIKGAIGKGMLTEGTTEAVQGGVEEYRTNVNVNEVKDIEGDNMEGVGASALESGLLGAFVGGGAGAPSGAVAKYRRRNFENQIESAITPEIVSQLRGAGKADQEIEQLLKPKIENKALSMGFDANEAQSLSSLAINAAFGRAPRAAERHSSEDLNERGGANDQQPQQPQQQPQPEAAQPQTPPIQQAQAPENLFSSFNHSDLVRDAQQAVSSIKTWEKQNRGNEHAKQLRQDMGRYLSTLNSGLSDDERQSAQRSMQSIYNEFLHATGQQPIAPIENGADPVQSEMFNQDTGEIFEPNSVEQQPSPEQQPTQSPEPVAAPIQSDAMNAKEHGLLVQAIQGGELDFADEQAQQDEHFRQGLERAFEYSPAAVLQVAQARKKGQMKEEQAISALQRIINSVELNKPDQLRPTDEEMILRNQQAQARNHQQQLEERGIRNNGHQPNVEESPEFLRNQAKLMQGMRQRQQTKGYADGQQWNGERDATPMPTGIEDQQVHDAPQVEFDRWSDVQPGDLYADERYSSEANEYELNPEEFEQVAYRQHNVVAQEPATAPEVEERKPKHNARQAKKLSKQQAEQAAELQRQLEAERAEIEAENAPVYQTPGLSQRTEMARQLGRAQAKQAVQGRQNVNKQRSNVSTVEHVEVPPVKEKPAPFKVLSKPTSDELNALIEYNQSKIDNYKGRISNGEDGAAMLPLIKRLESDNRVLNTKLDETLRQPAKATVKQSHKGVDLEYPEISKEIENQYNRATHLGRGRDFNQEFHDQAKSLLDDLDSKGLLDTPERKAKAKQLIEKYLDESAQFVNWSSHQAASNPSWHITGRSGRDMSKYNDRAQKRADKEVSRIDRLIGMKKRIPELVESVMNDEQRAEKAAKGKETLLKNRESEIIGYLVGDIFSYMQDGRELLAKENRKWALAKAKKSLENLVYNDKSRAEKLLKNIDEKARQESSDKFGLMDIVGNKRSALGKYIAENFEEFNAAKPKSTKLAMPANTSRAVKSKLGKIATAQKKVEEAEKNLVEVETANSSDRFNADPNNPRIKAANGRVMTAQKAADGAYSELSEIWKAFKAKGGTKQQWDKVVKDKQGHTDTHSWDDMANSSVESSQETDSEAAKVTVNHSAIEQLQEASNKFEVKATTRVKNYELEPAWKEVSKLMKSAGADTHDLYSFSEWITSEYKSDRDKAIELAKKYLNGDPEPTPPNGGGTKPKAKESTSEPAAPKAKKGRTRPSDARAYVKAISDFNGGNYSQSEAVELINQFIEDVPKLEEEFQGHTKPQIVNLFARMGQFIDGTLRKDQLVSRAVDSIGSQLGAFLSDGAMFVVKKPKAVSEEIAAMTESAYDEMAKSRRDMRAEAEAESQRKKEALQEPKTLDDFQAYARANGGTIDAFTDQQLSEFDRLYTENQLQRNAEKEKRELEQKAQVKAVETDGTIALSKIDVLNEAKGEQRYGAAFSEVDSDTYNKMKAKAKQLGGWYARAYKPKNLPARFDFKTEQSRDDFLSVMGGLNVDQSERVKQRAQEKTQTKQEKQIEALRQKADALQAKVDESNSTSRLTNTARRASFAASAAAKADRQEAQANILRKIADGVESGQFMLLGNLNDMSQLEELTKVMSGVKWDLPENVREKLAYRDTQGNWHLKPETTFEQVARYVRFPAPQSTPASLEYIAREIENLSGYKMTAKSIRSNIKGMKENDRINLNGKRWDKVIPKLRELARSSSNNVYRVEHINELFKSQDRLIRMGIKGDITLRQALREYEQANNGKMNTRKEKTRLETLTAKIEDIVRGNRNAFNDFFPTPEAEVKKLIDLADIQPGMRVLEPNAGMGHIADQIAGLNGVDLDVGELAYTMSELLEEKGHNVVSGDYLEYHPGEIYDRIVMNPPFSNDADIHHINHALSMLKEGGKLVAITSSMAGNRGNTTNKNFRRYLDEVAAEEIPLAAGTFNKSLNPTGVATKIIVIEKQADIDYDDMRFSQTSEVEAKPVTSMAPDKVTQAAQEWINAYDGLKGVNLTVVPTMEDLHDLVETEHNAIVKGAWLSGDNRVVLVAENLKDVADVRRTLRHELIAHNGLYGTLSAEQQAKLTKQVESLRNNKALQGIFSEVDKSYKTAPDTVKAEEVIARIAEQESSLPRRLVDQVLTWALGALRRSGILSAEKVTLSEVRTMINNVDSNLRKPNGMTSLSNAVRFSQTLKGMTDAEANQTDNLASVHDALKAENEKAYKFMLGKLKNDWLTKQLDSMKNGGWALLNLRQIAEVGRRRVSNEVGNILDSYVETKDLFTTRKTDLIEKVHAQAEALNKFRRDNPEAAEQTFDLLHQATLADIDPSGAYKPRTDELKNVERQLSRLYMEYGGSQTKRGSEVYQELEQTRKDIKGEGKRKIKHAALRDKYLALSPEARKVFTDVRDHYVNQREEMDKALENRVNELAVSGSAQAGQNTYHRIMMEKARLGFYVPLGRFGQYWLSVQDSNGERHFQMYETEADMMQDVNKLQAGGYKLNNGTDEYKNGELKYGTKLNDSRGLSGASASFVGDVVKAISGVNTNDKVKDQLTDEIYQMYLSTMPDRSIRRSFIHRKGVAGFSEDAARVLADQGVRQANQQARLETEKQFSDLMESLKPATETSNNVSAGRLYNEMTLRHEWMMNPTRAKWAQSLTAFGFFWQIGISPASAMINLSQNWQVALPVIGSKYGFKSTAAEMAKLSVLFAKTFAAKKKRAGLRDDMDMTNGILGDVLNDEEKAALRHAIKIGAIDVTQMADLTGMAEQESSNYTGKMASLSRFIGAPFHWAEVMNREVAFITAYRMAKANGEKKADALNYATKATWDSHFDYSSRNRARFMQGDVAAVALQFRQYSQNMTYYLFRNAFDALKGSDLETRKLARRQLLATFGATFAIGGLNALPLATLAAIANVTYAMTFGDENEPWDAETELRAAINEALGEDLGNHIYYGTMPSVSSRINIDLLRMWVQEADAQNSVSWVENLGQQAMGVSFGTAVSFARGADYFIEGQTLRGIEQVTPKWIKDVFRTARYAHEGGHVTNRKGEILVSDVEPLEYVGQFLGFTPGRLVQQYDRNSALKGYEMKAVRRRQKLMNAYWLAYRTRDNDALKEVQKQINKHNQSEWGRVNPITPQLIMKSIKQRKRMMSKSDQGVHLNDRYDLLLNDYH